MSEDANKEAKPEIRKLSSMEAVRLRPGMYFGGTDERALLTAIFWVVECSLGYTLQGECTSYRTLNRSSG